MINKEMTIGEAIKDNPDIIQVLSEENIDYCCGGNRILEEVLIEQNLDIDSFIGLLNRQIKQSSEKKTIEDAIKLNNEDLIIYIIETHHIGEVKLINEIDSNMQKLIEVHYVSHGEELADIYSTFMDIKKDIIPHFYKEEKRDFPKFISTNKVDFKELEEEHEHVGSLLKILEEKTNNYTAPEDGCVTYKRTFKMMKDLQEDIHKHIFLENSVLFLR